MPSNDLFSWVERAPYPLPRAGCTAGVLGGKIIIAGGTYWRDGQKYWSDQVASFDPQTNGWSPGASLPWAHGDAAAVTCGERFYMVGGGAEGLPIADVWSYYGEAWHLEPSMKLPAPRRTAIATTLDDTLYV